MATRQQGLRLHERRSRSRRATFPSAVLMVALMLPVGGVLGCSGAADDSKLPPNVQDPATLKTPAGALARYRGALSYLGGAFDRVMTASGLITDELAGLPAPRGVSNSFTATDSRVDLSGLSGTNSDRLHRLRAQAREARGFLAAYAPDSSPALQGHLFAAEAYAEVWLADLFCSGIPMSTVDFEGNYTLAAGSTTTEVYRHAIALFDSALAISSDSVRIEHLAAVGKGRALLALGEYAQAAAAVTDVPDDFAYQVPFNHQDFFDLQQVPDSSALWFFGAAFGSVAGTPSVADREGMNGLDYRSSGDPRTATLALGADPQGDSMYFPVKYPQYGGQVQFTLASGVEARLIEAEAALQAGGGAWLATLNALRTDGTYDTQPNATDPSKTDTLWHAGTGGVAGLGPLVDPVDLTARVDLVFRERAFWLFLTGHRQGDLRRLIRLYPGPTHGPDQVYPTGAYPGAEGTYGPELVIPTPRRERELNPKYTGCNNPDA